MKVAILCPRTPRLNYGGLENYTMRLAGRLCSKGEQVEIYTTSSDPKNYVAGKIKVREFGVFAPNESYFFSLPAFFELQKSDADIIYSVGYNNLLTFAGILAKKRGQKFVVSINLSGEPPGIRKVLNFFYDVAMNLLATRIDAVVCVSDYELSTFRKRLWAVGADKFSIVPMGIDIEPIKKVKAGKKGNYILSAGRFVRVKEFHNLIPSFEIVAKKIPGIKLVLLGSGPMEGQLREMAKKSRVSDRIIFEKSVPLERISELHKKMKESQMFVNLVDCGYEGIISYDAIACEVPVLLCDRKGKLEYVEKGYAQAITNPQDHVEVGAKIIEMLKNPAKYTPKNPKIHSWDEIAQRMHSLFKGVL